MPYQRAVRQFIPTPSPECRKKGSSKNMDNFFGDPGIGHGEQVASMRMVFMAVPPGNVFIDAVALWYHNPTALSASDPYEASPFPIDLLTNPNPNFII
jgi:hypothetical protein